MIASKKNNLPTLSFWLWCIGFCLVTFDRVAVLPLAGFKFKAAYFFFAASFAFVATDSIKTRGVGALWKELLGIFLQSPWRYMVLLILYAFALDPFSITPFKSFGYSTWLVFDLVCIVGSAILLSKRSVFSFSGFTWAVALISIFLGGIILVDDFAYYVFDMRDGLIGFNQDTLLHWGVSRPHAFSYEPSYIGMFLVMSFSVLFSGLCHGVENSKRLPRVLLWLALMVVFIAILATTSRSAWLALAISIALISASSLWKLKKIGKEIYVFAILSSLSVAVFVSALSQKSRNSIDEKLVHSVIELKDGSGGARVASMFIGFKIGQETHYLGSGMGASYLYWQRKDDPVKYAAGLPPGEQGAQIVMSSWMESFAELGAAGFLLYFFFAVSLCRALFRGAKVSNDPLAFAALASALCFFFFSAHWMPNLSRSDVWVWYAVWAVIFMEQDDAKNSI